MFVNVYRTAKGGVIRPVRISGQSASILWYVLQTCYMCETRAVVCEITRMVLWLD